MSACNCSGFECQNVDNSISDTDLDGYCDEDVTVYNG